MARAFLLLAPLLAAAAPHVEPDLPDFEVQRRFADAAGCRTHIAGIVAAARRGGFDAAEGPYDFAAGDVRAHTVFAAGSGHRIAEYRCLADRFSARSWTHAIMPAEEEFTVESVARRAPWLQHGGRQQ
ncbi:MAG TPA: hypothetical protein VF702_01430 [Allosphingosinicella sp.]|jgi:hypothetical protein